jgi:hypothetical protein
MYRTLLFCACCATCLWSQPAAAQSSDRESDHGSQVRSKEAAEILQTIRALETKLKNLEEEASADSGPRVKRLGTVGDEEDPIVLRIYEMDDLFTIAPSYPALLQSDLSQLQRPLFLVSEAVPMGGIGGGGGFGGGGGGQFSIPSYATSMSAGGSLAGRLISQDSLIEVITSSIEPVSWDEVGGPGSIQSLGTMLIIGNTEHVHRQIADLLKQLRERWGVPRIVMIRCWWLWQSDQAAAAMLANSSDSDFAPGSKPLGLVDQKVWNQQLQVRAKDPNSDDNYQTTLMCFSGQTVSAVAGTQTLHVTGMTPVVGSKPGYQPGVSLVQQGAAIQLLPVTSTKGEYATLDIQSRVALLKESNYEARPSLDSDIKDVAAAIERPVLSVQRLATTTRVPIDHTLLVGGMTFPGVESHAGESLYLYVHLSVRDIDYLEEANRESTETLDQSRPEAALEASSDAPQ